MGEGNKKRWDLKGKVSDTLAQLDELLVRIGLVVGALSLAGILLTATARSLTGDQIGAKTLSIFALVASTVSASAGASNFTLSRFRFVKVREITSYSSASQRTFTVDVLSYGAAVSDMTVSVEMFVPPTPETTKERIAGWFEMELKPDGKVQNPLNAGQAQRFKLDSDNYKGETPELREHVRKILAAVPKRNVALNVYCNSKRTRLVQVKSPMFLWRLDYFLEGQLAARCPWWQTWRAKREIKRLVEQHNRLRIAPKNSPNW